MRAPRVTWSCPVCDMVRCTHVTISGDGAVARRGTDGAELALHRSALLWATEGRGAVSPEELAQVRAHGVTLVPIGSPPVLLVQGSAWALAPVRLRWLRDHARGLLEAVIDEGVEAPRRAGAAHLDVQHELVRAQTPRGAAQAAIDWTAGGEDVPDEGASRGAA